VYIPTYPPPTMRIRDRPFRMIQGYDRRMISDRNSDARHT
jgi:hypothetical protein